MEAQTVICPECASTDLCHDGNRYYNGLKIQRFLCKNCELRFSDPTAKRLNVMDSDKRNSQICAFEAKNLDTATEIKTVAEEIGKTQQDAKGKILELCLYLKRQNYSEETIRLNRIALKVLHERGATYSILIQ